MLPSPQCPCTTTQCLHIFYGVRWKSPSSWQLYYPKKPLTPSDSESYTQLLVPWPNRSQRHFYDWCTLQWKTAENITALMSSPHFFFAGLKVNQLTLLHRKSFLKVQQWGRLWTHNTIYRWYIIELFPWNLCNFINQCHPNKFHFKN